MYDDVINSVFTLHADMMQFIETVNCQVNWAENAINQAPLGDGYECNAKPPNRAWAAPYVVAN